MSKVLGMAGLWTAVVLVGTAAADGDAHPQPVKKRPKETSVASAHEEYIAAIAAAKEQFELAVDKAHKRYLRRLKAVEKHQGGLLPGGLASGGISPGMLEKPKKKHAPINWSDIYQQSAGVRVLGAEPVSLSASEESGWERVPPALRKRPALVHSDRENEHNGVADIDVTRDGILLVACNYGYQGNNSGDWDEKRWTKEQFVENGWTLVPDKDLGGVLVKKGGREQVVFMRHVKKGENYRLRCNKYDPPFAIVFP